MSGQFGVYAVERISDPTIVTGRCHEGPLGLGDAFIRHQHPDERGQTEIHLTITKIEMYRLNVQQLDRGVTAQLTLTGDGGPTLVPDSVLDT